MSPAGSMLVQDAYTVCPQHRPVGTSVSQPLLGPVAAPRGVGMSSAVGNVLCGAGAVLTGPIVGWFWQQCHGQRHAVAGLEPAVPLAIYGVGAQVEHRGSRTGETPL